MSSNITAAIRRRAKKLHGGPATLTESETTKARRRVFLHIFAGKECLCGQPKRAHTAFCFACHKKLPLSIIRRLTGFTFYDAYVAACDHLSLALPNESGTQEAGK